MYREESYTFRVVAITSWLARVLLCAALAYLWRINRLLQYTPEEGRKALGPRWTEDELRRLYRELDEKPTDFFTSKLPPKLERRYAVTGGNGTSWSLSPEDQQ